ncbi:MAG: transcription elongation factor GreA [Vulcanimicrobiota bacterium]
MAKTKTKKTTKTTKTAKTQQKKSYKLTKEGYKKIEKKLKFLKATARPDIIERIRQAKESGPLEENTEYKNAREDQAKLEFEIARFEDVLRNADIIKKPLDYKADKVDLATAVTVLDMAEDKELTFEIVGSQEIDPTREVPRISDESPLGSALMDCEVNDEIEVEVPLGSVKYKIINIINII